MGSGEALKSGAGGLPAVAFGEGWVPSIGKTGRKVSNPWKKQFLQPLCFAGI